jgi:dephospho-CoA kinase
MMKVIGLAGRAGSGKSTVARFLAELPGIEWIDLDAVAWETYAVGTDVYKGLIDAFGESILSKTGDIDRARLAQAAFATPQLRQRLNELVHPAVSKSVESLIDDAKDRNVEILLIEGALLATSPHVDRSVYDRILWLETSDNARLVRLQAIGRSDHAKRGRDVTPTGAFTAVSNEGSVKEIAEQLLQIIRSDRS